VGVTMPMPDGRNWNDATPEELRAEVFAVMRFRMQVNQMLAEIWARAQQRDTHR